MASTAQVEANRANAQHSTGPKTEAGKHASSLNNCRHGLSGHVFVFLEWEQAEDFDRLQQSLEEEHRPATPTERILVEKMAQHHWLSQRAQALQTMQMEISRFDAIGHENIALFIRYQTHYDRLFQRALHDLLKLRAERRKAEIGFVSQKCAEAQEVRREAAETRKLEQHKRTIAIAETRLERELILTGKQKKTVQAPPSSEIPPEVARLAA